QIPHGRYLALIESLALPVCQFTCAPRCRRFRGEATYGYDHLTHLPFYGFRLHVRVCWTGVLCQMERTPGNGQELAAAEDLTAGTSGVVLGNRNFWAPRLREQLAHCGIQLLAPFRRRTQGPRPHLSRVPSRWRYRIDTIFGQLVERTALGCM
ncbi:MAG TPA: transposase, partial [Ktedonobacterales bacterium]|nr:transposase [Ktedonobacterales bacterium]